MFLDTTTFKTVIQNTPLISIDLIIENKSDGKILLGKRTNRPAQGYWFVPGGRVFKDEPLTVAFERLTQHELGHKFALHQGMFLGVYEHFYKDNVFDGNSSTHYIVLGYHLIIDFELSSLPDAQHELYLWQTRDALLNNERVHDNTRAYFL